MQKIGKRLVKRGVVTAAQLEAAVEMATRTHTALNTVLVEQGYVGEVDMLQAIADQHGIGFTDIRELSIPPEVIKAVPAKLASHYEVMPVRLESGVLTLAVSNPLDMAPVEDIEANLGLHVERILAGADDIREAVKQHYGVGAATVQRLLSDSGMHENDATTVQESHDLEQMAEDASVVRLVNQLLQDAITARATDLHLEVGRAGVVVRRRVDGVLYDTSLPPDLAQLYPAMVSRVKLMSGLNIVERRLPQDGRSGVRIKDQQYDLRVSIVPSIHGEDIVIRVLPASMLFELGSLGLSKEHRASLEHAIAQPHGILFVTGPTGSGKSTTLYACLSKLNTRERKIITIEDPVEYELQGVTQTQVQPGIGLTFSRALRSMLRHDPDVMMVGEVRDAETAEIAVQTAMTGHLVLSTLHTNDAAGAAVRLIDMGVDPYLITSTVLMFMAQRLVRVICPDCKESVAVDGQTQYHGTGCRTCNQSGYRGRVAICEFLPLESEIQKLILARRSAREIREQASAMGMGTLAEEGVRKVAQGVTTQAEVLRVTSL